MAKAVKKITSEVLGVISRLVVEQGPMAWVARITDGQLDRKVYVAFNEAVETLGGKWHKGAKGALHVYAVRPSVCTLMPGVCTFIRPRDNLR